MVPGRRTVIQVRDHMFTLQNKNITEQVSPHPLFPSDFHSFLLLPMLSILAIEVFLDLEDKHIAQKKRIIKFQAHCRKNIQVPSFLN